MYLMRYITGLFRSRANAQESTDQSDIDNSQNRALVWLGKDRLERQYFYEKWASHESWQIFHEALPLLLGRDPADPELDRDTDFLNQQSELWEHLKRCVQRGVSPLILNPTEEPESWQAEPVELYRWAIAARLDVPEELDALLIFISTTIKPSHLAEDSQKDDTESRYELSTKYIEREQVLSAMLALALQKINQGLNTDIHEMRQEFIESIYTRSPSLFNQEEPPLSRPALHDLFDRSLETAGLVRI